MHEWRNKHKKLWPSRYSDDALEQSLGYSPHNQRTKLLKQELSEQRMQQLQNIPGFACAQQEQQWNDTYLQICAWVEDRLDRKTLQRPRLPSRRSSDVKENKN